MGRAIRESVFEIRLGKVPKIGNAFSLTEEKDYSCLCMWTI